MKKIIFAVAALSIAGAAFGMGQRPGQIAQGADSVSRAELDALTARYKCALPKFTPKLAAAKSLMTAQYNLAVEAQAKSNRTSFEAYAGAVASDIANLHFPC